MTKRNWTPEETELLERLMSSGTPLETIAERLGRSLWSIKGKFKYDRQSNEQREQHRYRFRQRYRKRVNSPRLHENSQVIESSRPDEETLLERDRRYATPFRDLTGLLLGDPPVGYSALDRA